MISRTSECYIQTEKHAELLVAGTVLCIDPSVGSRSSQPGWAVYEGGELVDSGIFKLNPEWSISRRLSCLAVSVLEIWDGVEALIYEEIPVTRHGGSMVSHASLLKAVGAILSVHGDRPCIGIYPTSWKKMARPEYVKSDENDAIEIGHVVISLAREILSKKIG